MSGARFTEAELKAKGFKKGKNGHWSKSQWDLSPEEWVTAGGLSVRESYTPKMLYPKKPITAKASAANSPKPRPGWESEFAEGLEVQKLAGDILQWDYEPERFRVSKSAFYKPDFRVVRNDGTIVFYEVKGHFRAAAKIRMKVVVERHPYIFYIVVKKKSGGWDIQEFKG